MEQTPGEKLDATQTKIREWRDAQIEKLAKEQKKLQAIARYYGFGTPTESLMTQMQPPAPTDATKTTGWTRGDKLGLVQTIFTVIGVIVAILALWIALIQVGIIQNPISAVMPTLTPTLVFSTPTP